MNGPTRFIAALKRYTRRNRKLPAINLTPEQRFKLLIATLIIIAALAEVNSDTIKELLTIIK